MTRSQQQITNALDGAGFTRTSSEHFEARRTWGGQVVSAERFEETWHGAGNTITITYDKTGQIASYGYAGDNGYGNGGASVNLRPTKRNRLVTTSAQLREMLIRNIDELATGCRYVCRNDDGVISWVREDAETV